MRSHAWLERRQIEQYVPVMFYVSWQFSHTCNMTLQPSVHGSWSYALTFVIIYKIVIENVQPREFTGRKALLGDLQNSEMAIQIQNIHVDEWFQQYTNSDLELNPDPDTVTAAMAHGAFSVILEKWCFAPYDLACSREVFYNELQFYCKDNLTIAGQSILAYCFKWN